MKGIIGLDGWNRRKTLTFGCTHHVLYTHAVVDELSRERANELMSTTSCFQKLNNVANIMEVLSLPLSLSQNSQTSIIYGCEKIFPKFRVIINNYFDRRLHKRLYTNFSLYEESLQRTYRIFCLSIMYSCRYR